MLIADRYRLEREIARGGMGAVWLGHDEVLGRVVALKRIGMLPGATSPDVDRATREARLAAALNHPHVVAIYDQVDAGDEHWLVMEYVAGSTLAELVRSRGRLAPDEAAPILRQAAEALAAAHEARIVHRDVKPSNMLVTETGQVKLTDFGIARMEADATLTQTGLMTGSPAYLAPEIAAGEPATEASDVWSLGASLYHALEGRPPYDMGGNLMAGLYRLVNEEPPRLATAGWLAPLLEATMQRRPEDRWSMGRVAAFLAGEPEATRTFAPVVDAPAAETPAARTDPTAEQPVLAAATATTEPGDDRRPRAWLPAVLVTAAVLVVLLGAAFAGGLFSGDPEPPGADPSSSAPSSSTPSDEGSSPAAEDPTQAMEDFVTDYLALVTSDRRAAWERLTPAFQDQSGGFGSYQGFWRTIRSAEVTEIRADPDTGVVDYTVDYVRTDGSRRTDRVSLQLVEQGDGYLVDDEL